MIISRRISLSLVEQDSCKLSLFCGADNALCNRLIVVTFLTSIFYLFIISTRRASHVVILLTKKYPQCKIVNFDRLDCKLS